MAMEWPTAQGDGHMPDMDKYQCTVCGYVYDPEQGDPDSNIPPGTAFSEVPADWRCPTCGAEKSDFVKM